MTLNFAHRGSLEEAPENTIPAFKKALEYFPNAIELDVQLTKDHQLVVVHDHKLTRYNPRYNGLIQDYTLAEMKQIDVGSSFSSEFEGVTLPTLDEVLELCPKEVILNIEIKNLPIIYEGIEARLIDCLQEHDRMNNVIISSFDHYALQKVQELSPDLQLGLLLDQRIVNPWSYARSSGLNITSIHPNVSFTDKDFIDQSHRFGYKVYPFTVNDVAQYHHLVELGVDGVFSNNPKIFAG